MEIGLFILAVTLSALSGLILLVVGATVDWEEPCTFKLPSWDNTLAAVGMLIAQAVCWGVWGILYAGGA